MFRSTMFTIPQMSRGVPSSAELFRNRSQAGFVLPFLEPKPKMRFTFDGVIACQMKYIPQQVTGEWARFKVQDAHRVCSII